VKIGQLDPRVKLISAEEKRDEETGRKKQSDTGAAAGD
jgi:hypothetical protein